MKNEKGNKPTKKEADEVGQPSMEPLDRLSQRYQNAYQWYFELKKNTDTITSKELGYLLEIEEAHKTEILKSYNKSLESHT